MTWIRLGVKHTVHDGSQPAAREDEANRAAVKGSEYDFMVTKCVLVIIGSRFLKGSGDGMYPRRLREKLMAGTTKMEDMIRKIYRLGQQIHLRRAGPGLLSLDTALLVAAAQNRIDC